MRSPNTRSVGAFHRVHLDHMVGVGLLVCPSVDSDVWLGPESLQCADRNDAIRNLDTLGWEPLQDDYGLPFCEGQTAAGGEIISLLGRNPITSEPSLEEIDDVLSVLLELAQGATDA
jgi:hypothetical protein